MSFPSRQRLFPTDTFLQKGVIISLLGVILYYFLICEAMSNIASKDNFTDINNYQKFLHSRAHEEKILVHSHKLIFVSEWKHSRTQTLSGLRDRAVMRFRLPVIYFCTDNIGTNMIKKLIFNNVVAHVLKNRLRLQEFRDSSKCVLVLHLTAKTNYFHYRSICSLVY